LTSIGTDEDLRGRDVCDEQPGGIRRLAGGGYAHEVSDVISRLRTSRRAALLDLSGAVDAFVD
jgi:hypothetical protein